MNKIRMTQWLAGALLVLGLTAGRPLVLQAGPVPDEQLLPFLQLKIPGWQASGEPSGSTTNEGGVHTSQVKASFRSGKQTLEVMIIDFPGNGAPFPESGQPERESSAGYVRHMTVQGFEAQETYRPNGEGDLLIKVEYRFMVIIEGAKLNSADILREVAAQLDLKKLAALAK